ncbi:hypothetical protein [Piscibacillus halophilus]|nr:hypothetical protein [Piscibacillus halophilus]
MSSLSPSMVNAEEINVEIFDVETEQVVKTVSKTDDMQHEVERYIESIDDIFKGIDPVPEDGFMIKIPLDPVVKIDNEWLQSEVDTVIIIKPENEKPYLLLFDEENRPWVFLFETPIDELLSLVDYP